MRSISRLAGCLKDKEKGGLARIYRKRHARPTSAGFPCIQKVYTNGRLMAGRKTHGPRKDARCFAKHTRRELATIGDARRFQLLAWGLRKRLQRFNPPRLNYENQLVTPSTRRKMESRSWQDWMGLALADRNSNSGATCPFPASRLYVRRLKRVVREEIDA